MSPFAFVILGLATLTYAYWLYQTVIAVRGLAPAVSYPSSPEATRFAIVVPAHNEEAVIGALLDSLAGQRYPVGRADTYVSCDRCTDRTADVAAARGATVLMVPQDGPPGKSPNLAYALGAVPLHRYDAVAIFDADNVAHPDFLARMSDALVAEPSVPAFQGYLDVKNPHDSWVTTVYALSFWYVNRFWQLARSRARLAVVLGGTGQVIRTSVLARYADALESLTDDLELTCRIVLGGERVAYVPDAIAYDEKPTRVGASVTQRERWLRGHYWSFRRSAGALMRSFLRTRELRYLDLTLHLAVPGRASVLYVGMFAGLAVALLVAVLGPALPAGHPLLTAWPLFALAATIQCLLVLVVAPSIHDRRPTLRYVPAVGPFLLYGLVWIPRVVTLPFARRAPRWVRTEHTRVLTLKDIERADRRRSGR